MIFTIFFTFCYFGLLCLSGGSSLIQFYIDELVNSRHWLTMMELGNFMAISQVTPGPIGVNLATFLGFRQGGLIGGMVATVGLLLPSFFLMSMAVHSYQKWQKSKVVRGLMYGGQPIMASLILSALFACIGISILTSEIPFDYVVHKLQNFDYKYEGHIAVQWETLPILAFSMWALYRKRLSIMAVIFSSAGAGLLLHGLVLWLKK